MIAAWLALAVLAQAPAATVPITEIRVHGNVAMSDAQVIALSGATVGSMLAPDGIAAIEKRLHDSGRFDEVDVRKRYRTLEMQDVSLLLIVHEKPGVTASGQPPGLVSRFRTRLQFFPIVYYEDGYGWTYGSRVTFVDHAGDPTRITAPLSWGASKTGTVAIERTFTSGPFTRVVASGGVEQNGNPRFDREDRRTGVHVRAERRIAEMVTVGGEVARSNVSFGTARDDIWTSTADATLDTRSDPMFPSDAVFVSAAWSRLNGLNESSFGPAGTSVELYSVDARGYKRLIRQSVVAVHAHYDNATGALPDYDQWLLGGASIRGLDPGAFAGDRRFFWSAEARAPFTAPMNLGRLGFNVFIDGGATALHSQRLEDQRQTESVGAGVWMILAVIPLNFDLAHTLDGQGVRFHFGTGFTF